MFTDPQSITVNAVAQSMPRISTENSASIYATADEAFRLRISHTKTTKRRRHLVRVDQKIVAADPLTAENAYQELGVYLVVDEPLVGFSDTQIGYVVSAIAAWLSPANVAKVLGNET